MENATDIKPKEVFVMGSNGTQTFVSFFPQNADPAKTIDTNIYYIVCAFACLRDSLVQSVNETGQSITEEQATQHLLVNFMNMLKNHKTVGYDSSTMFEKFKNEQ